MSKFRQVGRAVFFLALFIPAGKSFAVDLGPVRISIKGGMDYLYPDSYISKFETRSNAVALNYRNYVASQGLTASNPQLSWKTVPTRTWTPGAGVDVGVMVTDNVSAVFRCSMVSSVDEVRNITVPANAGKNGYADLSSQFHSVNFMGGAVYEAGHDGKEGLAWHLGGFGGLSWVILRESFRSDINDMPTPVAFDTSMTANGFGPSMEIDAGMDYWFFTGFGLTVDAGYRNTQVWTFKYAKVGDFNMDKTPDAQVGDKVDIGRMDLSGFFVKGGIKFLIGHPRRPVPPPQEVVTRRVTATRTGEKVNIAVANLEPQSVSSADAAVISDRLRSEMVKTGAFNVVEKQNMEKILAEHAFQQTGCTSQECAVKLGRILNVKKMVVGSFGSLLNKYFISVRVVDVETGAAEFSEDASGANVDEIMAGTRKIAESMSNSY